MKTGEELKNVLQNCINDLEKLLTCHPFHLITEADLRSYLHKKLEENKPCNQYFKDGDKDENYLIHSEYPRGYFKGSRFNYTGRWDIAILDGKKLQDEEPDTEIWWKEKHVFAGFELKLNIDETSKVIINCFKEDQPAVDSEDEGILYSRWGVAFHLNIGKKRIDDTFDKVKNYIEEIQDKNSKTFYVYIESINPKCDLKPERNPKTYFSYPNTIHLDNEE